MTNPNTTLVEAIARAIDEHPANDVRDWARAALNAIQSSGMVVAPVEPTDAMLNAAMLANDEYRAVNFSRVAHLGPEATYRAMIQASQQ